MNHKNIKLHLCRLMLCAYTINLTPTYAMESISVDQQFTESKDNENLSIDNNEENNIKPNEQDTNIDVDSDLNQDIKDDAANKPQDNINTDELESNRIPNNIPSIDSSDDTFSQPDTSTDTNIEDNIPEIKDEASTNNSKGVVKNFISYIDGSSKLHLNDLSDTTISDTWNHTDTKVLHIEANVEDLDPESKYLKISLPLGMKLLTDPSILVDGRIISSVDTSNFSKNTITTSNSGKYTPASGDLIFKVSKDATFASIDLSVAADTKFWSTKNEALAHNINDKAIKVSVGDKDSQTTKKLDKVHINGNNWSPYYTTEKISSYMNDTQITMTHKMTIDYVQKVYTRIYKKVSTSIDIPYYTVNENGVQIKKYPTIHNITVKDGTYKIENDKIYIEWNNVNLGNFYYYIDLTFNSNDFPGNNKVTYNLGDIFVEDYFSGETIKVKSSSPKDFVIYSKYAENLSNTPTNKDAYYDTRLGDTKLLQYFGGIKLTNKGSETSKKGLSIEFPHGSNSDIGVSSIRLPTLKEAGTYTISYSLWDYKTNEVFDGAIQINKGAGSSDYTGALFNVNTASKNIASKIPNINSRELYFKSIEYQIGKLPINYATNDGPQDSYSGNFHGKVLSFNPSNTKFYTNYKLLTYDENNNITNEETKQIITTLNNSPLSTCGITSFGYYNEAGSLTSNILAGDNIMLKGVAEGSNYPYFNTQFLSTPLIYLRLPKGVSLDNSKTEFYWNKPDGNEKLLWNVVNLSNPKILSDGSSVYTIEFKNNDFGIGFFNENLSHLGKLTYNIALKTSKSIKSLTLNAKDMLFVGDKYVRTSGSGSWDMFFVRDSFDINDNGSTSDTISTVRSDSYLTITSNTNWLETDISIAANDNPFSTNPIEVNNIDDTVKVKLSINNVNEGKVLKDNFYYYLPIPKNNINYNENIKDKDEIFELSFNLSKFITVPLGFNVLYSSDNLNFYPKTNFDNLDDITMIKIVATKDIAAGDTANFIVEMNLAPDTKLINGHDTIWSPYGYQRYDKNGNSTSFYHIFEKLIVNARETIEDNWLNREVARQVFGDENKFEDLVDSDYLKVTNITLENKNFNQPIPREIRKLSNLTKLSVANCNLVGSIPTELSQLTELEILQLNNNPLTGSIPKEICNLSNLTDLWLYNTNLSGEIPSEIGNLSNLINIYLYNSTLSGTIPKSIGNLSKLKNLWLGGTNLSGEIPSSIGNLKNLLELRLDNSQISGQIPKEIGELNNLISLHLYNTKISGEIPSSIGNLTNLLLLRIYNTNISGQIPNSIGNLKKLQQLWLGSNKHLTGPIPTSMENLSNLTSLWIENSNLDGEIPEFIWHLPNLVDLFLHGNNLTGTIPNNLTTLNNLKVVSLANNNLSGEIPEILSNLDVDTQSRYGNAYKTSFSNNQFIGDLSNKLKDKFNAECFNYNLLEGMSNQKQLIFKESKSLSATVGNQIMFDAVNPGVELYWNGNREELSSAYTLDRVVDNNYIDSSLVCIRPGNTQISLKIKEASDSNTFTITDNPLEISISNDIVVEDNWLTREVARQVFGDEDRFADLTSADYKSITKIELYNNNFNAEIPKEIGLLVNLEYLILHSNNLIGTIPKEIKNLKKLCQLELQNNNLSGSIPSELFTLTNLHTLNLGSNNFSGLISKSIENLISLRKIYLYENNFEGTIPKELAKLPSLEYLNFRNNNFSGSIPAELSTISTLSYINLRGNKLTGFVPASILDSNTINECYLFDNQLIGLENSNNNKFKTEDFLKGNFIDGIPNQKEIVIKNPNKLTIEIDSKLVLPRLSTDDVEIRWEGNVEKLNPAYTLESILLDTSLFNSSLVATTIGSTEIKVKIAQANINNTAAQSNNSFDVEVVKKYIPLKVTHTLNTKNWTSQDVIVTINATSSDEIDYIECSDGTKIENKAVADFTIAKNGTYTFKVVTVKGESKIISVVISNIDKDAPTLTLSKTANSNQTFTITAKGKDNNGSGIKAIILPDGTYVPKDTATYVATWEGDFEFTVIDNAGNSSDAAINVTGITLDDLWLAKEVGRQVKKDYKDLTQEDFDKITSITLSNKRITGTIPKYIGNLTNLEVLKLNGNDLRGSIPSEIGNLEKLKTLWLMDNRLTGQIPSSIGNLIKLTSLDLGLNFLEGSIPSSIGQLENIQYIFLCENRLTGQVPSELGNLTKLRELCIDFNQLIGKIPTSVQNLKATKNFEYNFIEDSTSQNIMTVEPNTTINLSLDDKIDVNNIRYLVNITNGFSSNIGLNSAYSLEFIPDDESFFKDGKAIKTGTTTGKLRIAESSDSNTNTITKNSITVYIQDSSNSSLPDTIKPTINYVSSNTGWTNNNIILSINASDNVEIKEIILPNGNKTTDKSFDYTVNTNGVYTFTAIDTSDNKTEITIPVNNIDIELPIINIDYDDSTITHELILKVTGSDNLSGINKIILPDNSETTANSFDFIVNENGKYTFSISDNAGNVNYLSVDIDNISKDDSGSDTTPPIENPDDDGSVIPPEDNPDDDDSSTPPAEKPDEEDTPSIEKPDVEDSNPVEKPDKEDIPPISKPNDDSKPNKNTQSNIESTENTSSSNKHQLIENVQQNNIEHNKDNDNESNTTDIITDTSSNNEYSNEKQIPIVILLVSVIPLATIMLYVKLKRK